MTEAEQARAGVTPGIIKAVVHSRWMVTSNVPVLKSFPAA